jgi:hypothetical protein
VVESARIDRIRTYDEPSRDLSLAVDILCGEAALKPSRIPLPKGLWRLCKAALILIADRRPHFCSLHSMDIGVHHPHFPTCHISSCTNPTNTTNRDKPSTTTTYDDYYQRCRRSRPALPISFVSVIPRPNLFQIHTKDGEPHHPRNHLPNTLWHSKSIRFTPRGEDPQM